MLDLDKLWKILRYIKDDQFDISMDEITKSLSKHEQTISKKFFKSNLDQTSFSTNDYKRLRKFLIDWYASLRTISSIQRNGISDPYSISGEQLSELFKSFGYNTALDIVPLSNKAHFFLDLVNFYKKKGTPETIVDVLDYYGFSDADLIEYWLIKNDSNQLVFRPENTRKSSTTTTEDFLIDLPFNTPTSTDPHWLYTKTQIENLLSTNKINLPSKSPYFSLSSRYQLLELNSALSILSKVIHDEFISHKAGNQLPKIVPIKKLGVATSILALFTSFTYIFNKFLNPVSSYQDNFTFTYTKDLQYSTTTPPIVTNLSEITKEYIELIQKPLTRDERESNLIKFNSEWGQSKSLHYLIGTDTPESLLIELEPELKNTIDSFFSINEENTIIVYILNSIDIWLRSNINTDIPSLLVSILGFSFKKEVLDIINFFKPFRSRLISLEGAFVINNPLTETIIFDETFLTEFQQLHQDYPTPSHNPNNTDVNNREDYDDDWIVENQYDNGITIDSTFTNIEDVIQDFPLSHFEENYDGESNNQFDTDWKFDVPFPSDFVFDIGIEDSYSEHLINDLHDEIDNILITQKLFDLSLAVFEGDDIRDLHDSGSVIDVEPLVKITDTYSDKAWGGYYDTMDNDLTFDSFSGHVELDEIITDTHNDIITPVEKINTDIVNSFSEIPLEYENENYDKSIVYDSEMFIDMVSNYIDNYTLNEEDKYEIYDTKIDTIGFLDSFTTKSIIDIFEYSRLDSYHIAKELYDLDSALYDDLASVDDNCILSTIDNIEDKTLSQLHNTFDEDSSFDISYLANEHNINIISENSDIVSTTDESIIFTFQIIHDNIKNLDDKNTYDQLLVFNESLQNNIQQVPKDLLYQVSMNSFTEYQLSGPNEVSSAIQTGGFPNLDEEFTFDESPGRDVFQVYVLPA